MRDYPVSKAQKVILNALSITASGHGDAERIFESFGLVVASKRQGRRSVPVVTVLDRNDGGFNVAGEGVTYEKYPTVDFENIKQWIA